MTVPKIRVAVCGGGIGGLVCAITLAKYHDIAIDIYESASHFSEIEAGIVLFRRPRKVLALLGVEHDLAELAGAPPLDEDVVSVIFRKSDQPEGVELNAMVAKGGLLTLHRADLQRVLLKHLPKSCQVHFSKRLKSYEEPQSSSDPIILHFGCGSTASCDVLIGADGIKSTVRQAMLEKQAASVQGTEHPQTGIPAPPVFSGSLAYRALIKAEELKEVAPNHPILADPSASTMMDYLGKYAHVVAYPIRQGTVISLTIIHSHWDLEGTHFEGPWVTEVGKEEVGCFKNWEPDVQALVDCVDRAKKWAIHSAGPLNTYTHGRVALMGDAAHAPMPNQGAGAGQAIEDAYLLATLLGHFPRSLLPDILRTYDSFRRPFASQAAVRSRQMALYGNMKVTPDHEWESDVPGFALAITTNWDWIWQTILDGDVEAAIECLESGTCPSTA